MAGRRTTRSPVDGFRKAADAYRRAIALDPGYAAAYAELAMSMFSLADATNDKAGLIRRWPRRRRRWRWRPTARPTACVAICGSWSALDWAGAAADFEQAVALNPGDSVIQRRYSTVLAGLGRLPEALTAAKKAFDLDPLSETALGLYGWRSTSAGGSRKLTSARSGHGDAALDRRLSYLGVVQLDAGRAADALATFRRHPRRDHAAGTASLGLNIRSVRSGNRSRRSTG